MTLSTATARSWFSYLLLETVLDPVGRLHALRRVHLLRRIALHVDQRDLAVDQLGLAVRGLHDRLVALAERHLHRAAGTFEGHVLERRADLLVARPLAAVLLHRFLPGELHAEDRLRHLLRDVVR